ncbi:MAG: Crp/Fnr family transcriptional regulator [bacterium]
MFPTAAQNSPDEKKLLKAFKKLDKTSRQSLIDFAEFLATRHGEEKEPVEQEPLDIPRPESESVVKAIKRLSATYPMIEKSLLFNDTSLLMSRHILQGAPACEVIDELEVLFRNHFDEHHGVAS